MGHWVRASGILLSGWDYPKAAQKIRCIHKKNQVKCRHISKSYLSAHAFIIQLFARQTLGARASYPEAQIQWVWRRRHRGWALGASSNLDM